MGVLVGVVLGERVGRTTTGVGPGSGVGVAPQAERIQIVNNKKAAILEFIFYGEGVKVGRGVGVYVTVGVAVL